MSVRRMKMNGASELRYSRWEVEGWFVQLRGTLGTVGTLARFLGKSGGFSECQMPMALWCDVKPQKRNKRLLRAQRGCKAATQKRQGTLIFANLH